jgi:hypothetical protein
MSVGFRRMGPTVHIFLMAKLVRMSWNISGPIFTSFLTQMAQKKFSAETGPNRGPIFRSPLGLVKTPLCNYKQGIPGRVLIGPAIGETSNFPFLHKALSTSLITSRSVGGIEIYKLPRRRMFCQKSTIFLPKQGKFKERFSPSWWTRLLTTKNNVFGIY